MVRFNCGTDAMCPFHLNGHSYQPVLNYARTDITLENTGSALLLNINHENHSENCVLTLIISTLHAKCTNLIQNLLHIPTVKIHFVILLITRMIAASEKCKLGIAEHSGSAVENDRTFEIALAEINISARSS